MFSSQVSSGSIPARVEWVLWVLWMKIWFRPCVRVSLCFTCYWDSVCLYVSLLGSMFKEIWSYYSVSYISQIRHNGKERWVHRSISALFMLSFIYLSVYLPYVHPSASVILIRNMRFLDRRQILITQRASYLSFLMPQVHWREYHRRGTLKLWILVFM